MERVGKYCRALRQVYEQEGINSSHSVSVRKKIRRILCELDESDENAQALEMFWRASYYEPLNKLRKQKTVGDNWFNVMVSVFCGELQSMLAESPRHAAMYNLYLGDLHRLFLLALLARRPFQKAWDNLKKTFEQQVSGPISSFALSIPFIILVSYSRTNLDSEGIRLVEAIKSLNDPFHESQLASLLLILSLSCRLAVDSGNEDAFIGCMTLLCSCYLCLIDNVVVTQTENNVDDDEVIRIRRRRASSGSDSQPGSRSRSSSSSREKSEEKRADTQSVEEFNVFGGWLLAEVCEWLFHISPQLNNLKNRKKTPIPAALLNTDGPNLKSLKTLSYRNAQTLPTAAETTTIKARKHDDQLRNECCHPNF
ncbi:unnamed protein product [Haemonchus placei]|uniref:EST1_DNA_bind domain-containing protein n=1 Tax=Haemonchus placei TaxID=6290 RepID=A0A158QPT1_HAEPC|nr:unnamed protein product [Haemonchus placei]